MKKLIIFLSFLMIFTISNNSFAVLIDDFESYTLNTWPSPDWVPRYNAINDPGNNRIEVSPTDGQNQVLKLNGQCSGCWSAETDYQVLLPSEGILSLKIYNGSEILTGCHPQRAVLGFGKLGNTHFITHFYGNGDITNHSGNVIYQGYQTEQWYDLRISYTTVGENMALMYWLDDIYLGEDQFVAPPDFTLNLTSQEGSVYYDDIEISSSEPVPEPATMLLLGSGLIGLAGFRKRFRKRKLRFIL